MRQNLRRFQKHTKFFLMKISEPSMINSEGYLRVDQVKKDLADSDGGSLDQETEQKVETKKDLQGLPMILT